MKLVRYEENRRMKLGGDVVWGRHAIQEGYVQSRICGAMYKRYVYDSVILVLQDVFARIDTNNGRSQTKTEKTTLYKHQDSLQLDRESDAIRSKLAGSAASSSLLSLTMSLLERRTVPTESRAPELSGPTRCTVTIAPTIG